MKKPKRKALRERARELSRYNASIIIVNQQKIVK